MTTGSAPSSQGMREEAAVQDHPRWPGYLASLTKNGYFKGSKVGSAQYKELMTEAAQLFMQTQAQQPTRGAVAATPAQSIAAILEQPVQPELFKVTCLWCFCPILSSFCVPTARGGSTPCMLLTLHVNLLSGEIPACTFAQARSSGIVCVCSDQCAACSCLYCTCQILLSSIDQGVSAPRGFTVCFCLGVWCCQGRGCTVAVQGGSCSLMHVAA